MKRINIFDFAAIIIFIAFVCGSILVVRKYEQKANLLFERTEKINLATEQLETVFSGKQQNFSVWKTIEIGPYQNANDFRRNLKSKGYDIEYWANDILAVFDRKVFITDKLRLVLVSAEQLGFKDVTIYQEIFKRAQEVGFKPLPPEAAPQLRLQYPDQPENEWLHIGMEPILDSTGDQIIFDILHFDNHNHGNQGLHDQGHSLQLCSSSVRSDVLWSPSSKWVFSK